MTWVPIRPLKSKNTGLCFAADLIHPRRYAHSRTHRVSRGLVGPRREQRIQYTIGPRSTESRAQITDVAGWQTKLHASPTDGF
ncbi:hypothetical protein BHE74_00023334 [Ensete ventricosum]|nr:hypothetical protein BHE74_00023334 [Ensete ventricosum]